MDTQAVLVGLKAINLGLEVLRDTGRTAADIQALFSEMNDRDATPEEVVDAIKGFDDSLEKLGDSLNRGDVNNG